MQQAITHSLRATSRASLLLRPAAFRSSWPSGAHYTKATAPLSGASAFGFGTKNKHGAAEIVLDHIGEQEAPPIDPNRVAKDIEQFKRMDLAAPAIQSQVY